ncbi:MAG: glycoside hydrolase family 130 protein [Candidatus Zixiibacteriota bacterium]
MKRNDKNPVITRRDIPTVKPRLDDVSSVFNPGAVKFNDQYLLLLRVQNRGRETFLVKALSADGENFTVDNRIVYFEGVENERETIYHIYDPRITMLDGKYFIMLAVDMDRICRLGLAVTEDFERYRWLGLVSDDDNRNGVLFPEKINGRYCRLDRPNTAMLENGVISGTGICFSVSDDLLTWHKTTTVMTGRPHFWDERIGAGPPPLKTREGWLLVYHGVATHFESVNIYQAGAALLDLREPSKVITRGRYNILEPREPYEQVGQVPNVVFPGGMIVEQYDREGYAMPDSPVRVYYGAADTCVALAHTTVRELLDACRAGNDNPEDNP